LLFFVFISVIHSIDTDKARKAIAEYSYINQYSYASLLADYGFTEKQIKAWTATGTYIGWYLQQLSPLLNGYGEANPDMAITTIRNTGLQSGELSKKDVANIERFILDMAEAAIKMKNIALAERGKQQQLASENAQKLSTAEQQRNADVQAQYQRFVDDINQGREKTNQEVTEHFAESKKREQASEIERQKWEEAREKTLSEQPAVSPDTIVFSTRTGKNISPRWLQVIKQIKNSNHAW
jgi:hypothetical protein